MLQRKFRLPASVRLSHAETIYTLYFTVKIAQNDLEISRYGFIVGKKIDKRAVGRNRLKRRFRAGVEGLLDTAPNGYDFLFLLKKEAVEQSTDMLHQEITRALSSWLVQDPRVRSVEKIPDKPE
ncbi:MAG TPA: ribonuclease P protein component [Candidatus Saccharimonadales bacterium]|nr:ribonuclease P protein component [Candidatus Saccharimonadales bacterium]